MLSKLSGINCQPRASRETRNLQYIFLTAESTIKPIFIDRPFLPGLSLPISTLLCFIFPNSFSSFLVCKRSYPIQRVVSLSRVYTFQSLRSGTSYPSPSLLLHSVFSPSSHRNSLTMITPPSKIWTFFFARLSSLDAWLEEAKADYRGLIPFPTFMDWVTAKVETLDAAAPSSVTEVV